jgi:hypothetical protein
MQRLENQIKTTVEVTLEGIDGSQYYQGHGHSFSPDNLIACLQFNMPVQRVNDIEDLTDLLFTEINSNEFIPLNGLKDFSFINDADILKSLEDNDLKYYVDALNDLVEEIEDELLEEDLDDYDPDMYLYGYIHVYKIEVD